MRRNAITGSLVMIATLALVACDAAAQGKPPGTVTLTSAVTGARQFEGSTDSDGQNDWSSVAVSGGVTRQIVAALTLGVSVGYAEETWRIDDPGAFPAGDPWRDLARTSVGVPITLALSRSLLILCTPNLEWAGERGADMGDELTYGTVLGVVKVLNPRLTLGAGSSVSRQFYSDKVSVFLIVNWQLHERLRIANAHGAGPLGGAGVELRYTLDPAWELAVGGVIRSDRFRLADSQAYAGAIGERGGMPVFARASRRLGEQLRADLYAGAMLAGRLRIKDDGGDELATTRYPVAPAVAITFACRR